jgi:3'-5' exonuclease
LDTILKNLIFIDIETVSLTKEYASLGERFQNAWSKKALQLDSNCKDIPSYFFEKAAIYAEFGKVVVIGLGYFHENEKGQLSLRVKSLTAETEEQLLLDFASLVEKIAKPKEISLCAHNGKEFDFPYLCRRMLVNGVRIPDYLNLSTKKPWEVPHFDTLEMWKFGDRKSYTSLELLATVFDIPTSKQSIDGSQVNKTYYMDNNLSLIADYCRRDVAVLAQLFLKMNSIELPSQENIVLVD